MGHLYRLMTCARQTLAAMLVLAPMIIPGPAIAQSAPAAKTERAAEITPAAPQADIATGTDFELPALPPPTLPPTPSLRALRPGAEAIIIAQPPSGDAPRETNWLYIIGGALVLIGALWTLRGAPAQTRASETSDEHDKEPT